MKQKETHIENVGWFIPQSCSVYEQRWDNGAEKHVNEMSTC